MKNLYGTAKVRIPAPEFVVFYNGREQMPERGYFELSDLFMVNDRPIKLELEAVVLNISGRKQPGTEGSLPDAAGIRHIHRQDPAVYRGDVPGGGGGSRDPGSASERIF